MRLFHLICAASVALAGCTAVSPTGGATVEPERRTGGQGTGSATARLGVSGGSLVAAGAGNLVAAGAGNAISPTGGAGLVAAGAGNLAQPGALEAKPKAADVDLSNPSAVAPPTVSGDPGGASPLLGADGASLIGAAGGAHLVASGGLLTLGGGSELVPKDGDDTVPAGPGGETTALALRGVVRAPASLAGLTGTLPVGGARVALFDLLGAQIVEATTSAMGAFSLDASVPRGLYVVRASVTVGAQPLYLATLYDTAEAQEAVGLDPVSTLFEARFFDRLAGYDVEDLATTGASFRAWHAAASGLAGEVPLAALAPTATLASRAEAWQALSVAHPEVDAFAALDRFITTFAP